MLFLYSVEAIVYPTVVAEYLYSEIFYPSLTEYTKYYITIRDGV